MANIAKLKYAVVKPSYFSPFFNFKGLMMKKCKEGTINSDSDVVRAMRSIEKSLLAKRAVMDVTKQDKNFRIEQLLSKTIVDISQDDYSDGRVITIDPSVLGNKVSVCVKSNRIAIQNFTAFGKFAVAVGSQVLPYSNEKYSIGVLSADMQCGFAIEVCRDDSGIKGGVIAKVTYIDQEVLIIDRLDKYMDVTELLRGITG